MDDRSKLTFLAANWIVLGKLRARVSRLFAGQLVRAAVSVAGFTALVKLLAAGKDMFVGARFGTGDVLDAFLIAYMLPAFVINVVGGALTSSLIPTFIDVRETAGASQARRLLASTTSIVIGASVGLTVLIGLTSKPLIALVASGFTPAKQAMARGLLVELLPLIPLGALSALAAAMLNASRRFALAAVSPSLTPILTVAALALGSKKFGVEALVIGAIGGALLETALLVLGAWRIGLAPIPGVPTRSEPLRAIGRQFLPMVGGGLIVSSTVIVDQAMGAILGAGSVSVLNYGSKLVAAVTTLGSIALATAALPHFSLLVTQRDRTAIEAVMRRATRLAFWVGIPISAFLMLLSRPLIALWFERGAFTASDTALVSRVQILLLIQVPFFMLGILYVRLLSALKANSVLLLGSILNFSINIALNALLMQFFGIAGIALSTSLVYVTLLVYLRATTLRRLRKAIPDRE